MPTRFFVEIEFKAVGQGVQRLKVDARDAAEGIDQADRSTSRFKRTLGTLAALVGTVQLARIGTESGRMAAQFDSSFTRINTLVGVGREQLAGWRDDVLALGPAVGRGPRELAEALFTVTSAGERGSGALEVLRAAGVGASLGLGKTAVVAKVSVAALEAYGRENITAGDAVEILRNAVRAGNLEAEQLAPTLGRVTPLAAQMGVSFGEVNAFIARFTQLGGSAAEGVTGLRGTLNAFLKPAKQTSEVLELIGTSADGVRASIRERGLSATLSELLRKFDGNEEAIGKLIPQTEALGAALAVVGTDGGAKYIATAKEVSTVTGDMTAQLEEVRETDASQAFSDIQVELETLRIQFAQNFLPLIRDSVRDVSEFISKNQELGARLGELAATGLDVAVRGLKFLATHLDLVILAIGTLLALKVVGFFTSTTASIVILIAKALLLRGGLAGLQNQMLGVTATNLPAFLRDVRLGMTSAAARVVAFTGILGLVAVAAFAAQQAIKRWADRSERDLNRLTAASNRIHAGFDRAQKAIQSGNLTRIGREIDKLAISTGNLRDQQAQLRKERDAALDQLQLEEARTVRVEARVEITRKTYQELQAQLLETTTELGKNEQQSADLVEVYAALKLEQDKQVKSLSEAGDAFGKFTGEVKKAGKATKAQKIRLRDLADAHVRVRAAQLESIEAGRNSFGEQELAQRRALDLVRKYGIAVEQAREVAARLARVPSPDAVSDEEIEQWVELALRAKEFREELDRIAEIQGNAQKFAAAGGNNLLALDPSFADGKSPKKAADETVQEVDKGLQDSAGRFASALLRGGTDFGQIVSQQLQAAAAEFVQALSAGGGGLSSLSTLGLVAGVIGIVFELADLIEGLIDEGHKKFGSQIGLAGPDQVGLRPATFSGNEASISSTGVLKLFGQLRDSRDEFLGILGGLVSSFPEIVIQARNDGETVRLLIGGQLIGLFEDVGDASAAAIIEGLRRSDLSELGANTRAAVLGTSASEDLQVLAENISRGQLLDDAAAGLAAAGQRLRASTRQLQASTLGLVEWARRTRADVPTAIRVATADMTAARDDLIAQLRGAGGLGAGDASRALALADQARAMNAALDEQSAAYGRLIEDAQRATLATEILGGRGGNEGGLSGISREADDITNVSDDLTEALALTSGAIAGDLLPGVKELGDKATKAQLEVLALKDGVVELGKRISEADIAASLDRTSDSIIQRLIPAMQAWLGDGFAAAEVARATAAIQLAQVILWREELIALGRVSAQTINLINRGIAEMERRLESGDFPRPNRPTGGVTDTGGEQRQQRRKEIRQLLDDMERGLDLIGGAASSVLRIIQQGASLAEEMRRLVTFTDEQIDRALELFDQRARLEAQGGELGIQLDLARIIGDQKLIESLELELAAIRISGLVAQASMLNELGFTSDETLARIIELAGQAREALAGADDGTPLPDRDEVLAEVAQFVPSLAQLLDVRGVILQFEALEDQLRDLGFREAQILKFRREAAETNLAGLFERLGQLTGNEEAIARAQELKQKAELISLRLQLELVKALGGILTEDLLLAQQLLAEVEAGFADGTITLNGPATTAFGDLTTSITNAIDPLAALRQEIAAFVDAGTEGATSLNAQHAALGVTYRDLLERATRAGLATAELTESFRLQEAALQSEASSGINDLLRRLLTENPASPGQPGFAQINSELQRLLTLAPTDLDARQQLAGVADQALEAAAQQFGTLGSGAGLRFREQLIADLQSLPGVDPLLSEQRIQTTILGDVRELLGGASLTQEELVRLTQRANESLRSPQPTPASTQQPAASASTSSPSRDRDDESDRRTSDWQERMVELGRGQRDDLAAISARLAALEAARPQGDRNRLTVPR